MTFFLTEEQRSLFQTKHIEPLNQCVTTIYYLIGLWTGTYIYNSQNTFVLQTQSYKHRFQYLSAFSHSHTMDAWRQPVVQYLARGYSGMQTREAGD